MTYGQVLENKGEVRGLKRGIQQGMQQGIQQGMQQGMQQGIQQVAKSLFSQLHLGLEAVQHVTGLGKEELEQLQREANKE